MFNILYLLHFQYYETKKIFVNSGLFVACLNLSWCKKHLRLFYDIINYDVSYLLDRIRHTKIPFPEITSARWLTPFGINMVAGELTS